MVLSLEETMQMMGCGRSKVFELLADGVLEQAPRYGRHIRIYKESVEQALARPKKKGRKQRASSPTSGNGFSLDALRPYGD
jgi:excisionase family DNA binding protein